MKPDGVQWDTALAKLHLAASTRLSADELWELAERIESQDVDPTAAAAPSAIVAPLEARLHRAFARELSAALAARPPETVPPLRVILERYPDARLLVPTLWDELQHYAATCDMPPAEPVGALAARQGPDWQPIDSAPKDGTDVLLWWPFWCKNRPTIGWFGYKGIQQWIAPEALEGDGDPPTHWMPLPDPPGPRPEREMRAGGVRPPPDLWQVIYDAAANEGSILHDDTVSAIEAAVRAGGVPALKFGRIADWLEMYLEEVSTESFQKEIREQIVLLRAKDTPRAD